MTLRVRLALAFAAVALATGAVVALAAPFVIQHGFTRLEADVTAAGTRAGAPGSRSGAAGPPEGAGPAARAAQIQQDTTLTVIAVALAAAAVASLAGALVAGRIVGPFRSLETAAAAVAAGDLRRRSGVADRPDEVGSLGRSFDHMAEALQRSDDSRRRLLQDAAHELRTPLAVIDATASALSDGIYEPDQRHFATIRDQSRQLARVVDDLRTIGLAEDGRLSLRIERVRVDRMVSSAAGAFRARASLAGIELEVMPLPEIAIDADGDRLGQALGALLDNAIRHTPAGGRVAVTARAVIPGATATGAAPAARGSVRRATGTSAAGTPAPGTRAPGTPAAGTHAPGTPAAGTPAPGTPAASGRVRIEVADTGPGIAPADLPRIFDRFYQADRARDRSTGTTGLGLAIARAIVQAHGGAIGAMNRADTMNRTDAVNSSTPGTGAVFWIELPLAHVSIPAPGPSSR